KEASVNLRKLVPVFLMAIVLVVSSSIKIVSGQEVQSRIVTGNGSGTLRIGDEQFKISSVIVKLMDDHKAEITLVSDITVFLSGTWSSSSGQTNAIDLQVTSNTATGGVDGTGKLILSNDGKVVANLTLKGQNRSKRVVEVNFKSGS